MKHEVSTIQNSDMRILLATDQPFWLCRGGAQQRISCLWEAVRQTLIPATESSSTLVYYLGDPKQAPDSTNQIDIGQVVAACHEHSVASVPAWSWIRNSLKAASQAWTGERAEIKDSTHGATPSGPAPRSLSLNDYRWTWVEKHWNETVANFRPDVVILEYVTMTYLIDYTHGRQRHQIVWAVDTHDCLSQRAAQFKAAGEEHWLRISEAAEIAALEPTDLVIAIQDSERAWFAERLQKPKVVVAGHAPKKAVSTAKLQDSADPPTRSAGLLGSHQVGPSELRLGLLASNNYPNRHGIAKWLSDVAPHLHEYILVVGGSIGTAVAEILNSDERRALVKPRVRCLGNIQDLTEFYREIDVVLCPIFIGTGLKIKLVEGLSFHCPVLATLEATECFPVRDTGVVVCESPESWVNQIHELSSDRERLTLLRQQAAKFANTELQPEVVYGELFRELHTLVAKKQGV